MDKPWVASMALGQPLDTTERSGQKIILQCHLTDLCLHLFTPAAPPEVGEKLFDYLVGRARQAHPIVETGQFGADMQVSLVNDGPVTFWLRVIPVER